MASLDLLLRRPVALVSAVQDGAAGRLAGMLALGMVVSLALFGLVLGTFSMGQQLWAAPLKIVVGVFLSGLICLPSLYIFSCLNGLEIRFRALAALLVAALCLASLVLIGFAPVVWVFAQSTGSVAFMGALALVFWLIALLFGMNLFRQAASLVGIRRRTHLRIWGLVLVLVTLQMSTSLRPIVGTADTFLPTEKKSFVVHWAESVFGGRGARADAAGRDESVDVMPEAAEPAR